LPGDVFYSALTSRSFDSAMGLNALLTAIRVPLVLALLAW
jgi:hypothetical protein